MPKPTIYYIRHGQTDWNAAGRFQGSQDIPLNDLGRRQAAQAGGLLKELLARQADSIDHLFVASPLGRTRSTMELVRGAMELPYADYALDERLHEIRYGEWEGTTLDQQRAMHPELFAARERDRWRIPPPGGESYADVTARMRDWLGGLSGDTVAVAHGGTARALMVALEPKTPEEVADLYIEQGVVYVFGEDGLEKYS